jgi:hypothetical protein
MTGSKQMQGVTQYNPEATYQGYTLFCPTGPEPPDTSAPGYAIYLIDMAGKIVHEWTVRTSVQSHCQLLPNGNLLYPTHDRSEVAGGTCGLREIDCQSNVLWYYRCRIDHDFQVLDNGNLLIHTITDNICPVLGPELRRQPYLIEITRDKELIWEWRGEKHIEELENLLSREQWRHVMSRAHGEFAFDWAHNNTCQVICPNATWEKEKADGSKPIFKPGNILISYRSDDVIAVIDRENGEIVWAWGPGILDGQHKPHMLDNGNILIFDNGTLRGYSRVIELNPMTEQIEWEYTAEPKESFLSKYISSAQRLPNGNTLICEGGKSRLFEVTPEKKVVWNFVNPYGSQHSRTSIYRCLRYSRDYAAPLLDG